jgi:hypothetical protein
MQIFQQKFLNKIKHAPRRFTAVGCAVLRLAVLLVLSRRCLFAFAFTS